MAASIVIRQATSGDAETLARLRYDFRIMLDPPVEPAEGFVSRCTAWMSEHLRADGSWCCWIAEGSGTAIGMIWLSLLEKIPNPVGELEVYGYITNFYVQADHRGSGIGRQLLAAAVAECDRRKVFSTILWPTPQSRSLYARHGFAAPRTIMERSTDAKLHQLI
jgi:GNAT superfamily N-acetyltransferase